MSPDVPDLLAKLAELHFTSATVFVEQRVAVLVAGIVRCQPCDEWARFVARFKDLAAQRPHPRAEKQSSYSLGATYVEGIRQLQNSLGLPRQGLVVEYLVRAAWAVEGDDDGGGGDELQRRFRSTSRNIHPLVTSPSDGPEPATVQHPTRQLTLIRGGFLPD